MKWETVGCLIYRISCEEYIMYYSAVYLRYNIIGRFQILYLIYDNPKVVCPLTIVTVGEHCSP